MKKPLIVMTSGGRTSAVMALLCKEYLSDERELHFVFTNTGQEHEDTYRFLNDVDINFLDGKLIWVEAIINPEMGSGTTHKIVSYETASRNGEVYEAGIKKYGIPNNASAGCTKYLKLEPCTSYLREAGLSKAERAVGIRPDENRRVSKNATKDRLIYPLIDFWSTDKDDVLDFMSGFSWDLAIPEWQGNCKTCFKKSFKKLLQVWRETPEAFDFNLDMEFKHGRSGPRFDPKRSRHELDHSELPNSVFHRGAQSTYKLIEQFKEIHVDAMRYIDDKDSGCSESCEIYATEIQEEFVFEIDQEIDQRSGQSLEALKDKYYKEKAA